MTERHDRLTIALDEASRIEKEIDLTEQEKDQAEEDRLTAALEQSVVQG